MNPFNTYFQHFDNYKLSDIFPSVDKFTDTYSAFGFPEVFTKSETMNLLYAVMMGRYANSTILNYNVDQFKLEFMSLVWQHGAKWEKELEIQKELSKLSLEDGSPLFSGSKAIYNSAANPSTQPQGEELPFINSQNVTHYKKSKIEGLSILAELLDSNVTDRFLDKFKHLFKKIIFSGRDLYYTTYEENDND